MDERSTDITSPFVDSLGFSRQQVEAFSAMISLFSFHIKDWPKKPTGGHSDILASLWLVFLFLGDWFWLMVNISLSTEIRSSSDDLEQPWAGRNKFISTLNQRWLMSHKVIIPAGPVYEPPPGSPRWSSLTVSRLSGRFLLRAPHLSLTEAETGSGDDSLQVYKLKIKVGHHARIRKHTSRPFYTSFIYTWHFHVSQCRKHVFMNQIHLTTHDFYFLTPAAPHEVCTSCLYTSNRKLGKWEVVCYFDM